jgi:TP901 family phage tail tape measure protein
MATSQDTKVKIVDIQVKYQEAVDAMAKYRAAIDEARAQMKALKKDLKDGKITQAEYDKQSEASRVFMKQQGDAINTLSRQVQNQIKVQKENEGSLKQLRAELSNATAAYDAMSRAERESAKGQELKNHIVQITNELKGAEEGTLRFYRNVGNYPTSVNTALSGLTDKFKALGGTIAAAFTVDKMWSFKEEAEEVGTAYADQMAKVQSVTNANAVEFAQMSQEAERLGSTTRYTAQEAAESMEYLTRNGLDAVTATGTLSGVLHLAQANTIELGESADIVTGQMNAFHLSVNNVTRISDVLSYTCANSATNILQLNEALRNTAPIAYTAGVNIEETCAALGTLADNNIKGADAGTILKQAFNGMITSTKNSKKAYEDLGISMDISTVKADGFIGSLQKIMDASPSVQQLSDIFGRRAVPGVLALTNSMELLGDKFQSISENAVGTTDRMFEQAYSKYTIAKDSLKSAWEGFLIEIWQGTDLELRDRFVKAGEDIDAQFVPRIEELKQKIADLNAQYNQDPNNNGLLEEIKKTSETMGGVSREYALSKQLLSQQMQVEQTGNTALIDKWKQGAQAIDQEYVPKIQQIKSEIAQLQEQLVSDPTNEQIQGELDAKETTLKEGIRVYSEARQNFQDSLSDEIEASTSGLAGKLQGPIEQLTALVTFAKTHVTEIGELLMSIIAGISFAKLISGAKVAFTQMRDSAVGNAQAATQQVQICQNNEIALRKQTASLTKQLESANAIERERIETQLVAKKRELANAEKMTQKAKTAEITLWERASALETGSAWTKAFTIAKVGVTSFVATAKAAFKGFILTAVLSLAFDLLMRLYSKLSEGKGVWANLKSYATAAFRAIANAIIWVMNKCIDLYNKIALVRLPIQLVALQFKNLWEGVKLVFNLIIDGVKSVGRSLSGLGKIIKGVATFSWSDIKAGVKDITSNFGKTIQEGLGDFKKFGRNVADNVLDAYNKTLTQGAVAHITPIADDPIPVKTKVKTKAKAKASVNTPTETTDGNGTTPDANGDGNGKGDGKKTTKTTKTTKEDRARAKAAQEEAKLVAEAEKAMLDLLGECVEKRKALLENQYNGEINKLKAKLATDKTLTENSKEAIRQIIVAKEKKLQEELDKLDDDNIKRKISEQQKQIESRLSIVKKGSEEELNLKLEQNRKKADLDILALKQEEDAAQKGAATALMYRQKVLAELEQSGTATEEQLAQATASVEYAQSEITRISSDYAERRANRLEQSWQQEDQLRQAHNQFMLEQRQLALQNEMTMVEQFQAEELTSINDNWNNKQTLEQYMQEYDINAVTDLEMRKLQIQQEMAEQRLQFIQDQGQLETETEEQYSKRVIDAKKAVSDAKIALNKASLKNEQAYAKAMGNVGDSIISLMDAIGESDKNFAKLSKIITLFKITVDTGKAISAGVANAMELPYPANLAAVATTVATVLSNIATAVSTVKSANFAEGGKVNGPGTGTSDSIPANLSNGEFVMTAKATKIFEPLLTVMNSIGAGVPISMNGAYERVESAESLTDSFAEAAREIKPIVSVVEITEAQDRIKMIENLDNF